jgi:hypothetical protein
MRLSDRPREKKEDVDKEERSEEDATKLDVRAVLQQHGPPLPSECSVDPSAALTTNARRAPGGGVGSLISGAS